MSKPRSAAPLTEQDRDLLRLYVSWLQHEIDSQFAVSTEAAELVPALRRYGEARGAYFDRLNAIQILQQVEDEGIRGDERFSETARRVWNLRRDATPGETRKIRRWWEERASAAHLVDDERLTRGRGRPIGRRDKSPRSR